ncbi:ABC transporter ATP-binding protein [Alteribacter populi]|uniref:ABC transporter ATP-binding protein n=1 Tax=Alteribacter populi TaxID=2011011 RepID=UPI000BBB4F5D|nr:ABC transporter ATP-binding protein [Alteribacter populi]
MSENYIEIRGLNKRYQRKKAVTGVDLQLHQPGMVGLVGPNGSGKSTLLKIIAGMLRPSSGDVYVMGERTNRMIANKVAYLAEVDSLYDYQRVRQAVAFFEKVYPDFSSAKSTEMLEELNIDLDDKIKNLSKGNRARVKLAITLARDVPILLLDEPLSGLDPIVREEILKMIIRHTNIHKQITFISTHEVAEVEPFLDHIVFVKQGEILLSENVETIREERGQSVVEAMREVLQ